MNAGPDPEFALVAEDLAQGVGLVGAAPTDLPVAMGSGRSVTESSAWA